MFDENSPEMRLALAPYEDSMARFDARMAEVGEDFARDMAEYDKYAAQRDKAQAEQLAAILEQREHEKQEAPEQHQNQWTAPREKETTISFGEFDDEERAEAWATPTPPMGFPPPPPIPEPIPDPEPLRTTAPEPMMTFGELELDEQEPPQPPAANPKTSGRRRLREDDEDMSGQSWLS